MHERGMAAGVEGELHHSRCLVSVLRSIGSAIPYKQAERATVKNGEVKR